MTGNSYLLTGASGFFGRIIREALPPPYRVSTLGRSAENDLVFDLSKEIPEFPASFDVVIHNAGKAHVVPKTSEERKAFDAVNVIGTENLLKGLKKSSRLPKAIIFISSVAVYGISEGENIKEGQPLKASDPYGNSKIKAEQLLEKWAGENHVSLTVFRLPLLAGENPPGNLAAMIHGIQKGMYVSIAGGKAKKSMVMAADVASIIPLAAERPGTYNLTDGYHPSFGELESLIAAQAGVKPPRTIPPWVARVMGIAGDVIDIVLPGKSPVTTDKIRKITSTLTFDDLKARRELGWNPRPVISAFRIR
jgi:nucleoside-diphosphate-sugar epimerase